MHLLVCAGVLVVLAVGAGFWLLSPKQHFGDEKIDEWAKAVADLDSQMTFYAITKPQEHSNNLTALRLNDQPTKPLDIWRKLEPLLRLSHPGPAGFAEMRKLAGNLYVLSGMFEVDEKYAHGNLQDKFKELHSEIIHWQNLEGKL